LTTKNTEIFDGAQSPVRQRESAAFNARLHENHGDQAAPLPGASVHRRTFLRREHAHRLFEEARTSVSGNHRRPRAALDLGATLAGSSNQNISVMSAFSDRLLTALGPGALGNASPRIFHRFFIFIWDGRNDILAAAGILYKDTYNDKVHGLTARVWER
jgi:hypothetical protein